MGSRFARVTTMGSMVQKLSNCICLLGEHVALTFLPRGTRNEAATLQRGRVIGGEPDNRDTYGRRARAVTTRHDASKSIQQPQPLTTSTARKDRAIARRRRNKIYILISRKPTRPRHVCTALQPKVLFVAVDSLAVSVSLCCPLGCL